MVQPSCALRETSRYTQGSGATVIQYLGADGREYHCTIHTNGLKTWSGFQVHAPSEVSTMRARPVLNRYRSDPRAR